MSDVWEGEGVSPPRPEPETYLSDTDRARLVVAYHDELCGPSCRDDVSMYPKLSAHLYAAVEDIIRENRADAAAEVLGQMNELLHEEAEINGQTVRLTRLPDGTLIHTGIWYGPTDGYIGVGNPEDIANFYRRQGRL